MYLLSKRIGKMTDHIDLGYDKNGKHLFKCPETGDVRENSKATKAANAAKRNAKKEADRQFYEKEGKNASNKMQLSPESIQGLKEQLNIKTDAQ